MPQRACSYRCGSQLAWAMSLYALTQRADAGVGSYGELLLSEVFLRTGLSSHYGLLSIGYPTLGVNRFLKLGRENRLLTP